QQHEERVRAKTGSRRVMQFSTRRPTQRLRKQDVRARRPDETRQDQEDAAEQRPRTRSRGLRPRLGDWLPRALAELLGPGYPSRGRLIPGRRRFLRFGGAHEFEGRRRLPSLRLVVGRIARHGWTAPPRGRTYLTMTRRPSRLNLDTRSSGREFHGCP